MDLRHISPGGKINAQLPIAAELAIILRETFAHLARRIADHRVLIGVVLGMPVEYRYAQRTFLQQMEVPLARSPNHVPQQIGATFTGSERWAAQDTVQLLQYPLWAWMSRIERCFRTAFQTGRPSLGILIRPVIP